MTILNFQQNNYRNTLNVHEKTKLNGSSQNVKVDLLLQIVTAWMEYFIRRNQQAGGLIASLQKAASESPGHEYLATLDRLQGETATDLQKLADLLGGEAKEPLAEFLPPYGAGDAWIWYTLQLFFEAWYIETADTHLWLLTRPVLCAEDVERVKERKEAVSFYELAKLLIDAAWALHQEHTKQFPAP